MKLQEKKTEPINCLGQRADFIDEKYGQHPRNTFDLWQADKNKKTPLVLFIHGGGFVDGDKSRYYDSEDWGRLLKAGISVATINYRFMNEAPYGILASMNDSKRCLQHLRYYADKYRIDKSKIAVSGGSAGAGTALWLAFSKDMADGENDDPVLRESTRVSCAAAFSTQATYDILQWKKILNLPDSHSTEELFIIGRTMGFKSLDGIDIYKQTETRNNLDFLGKMDKNSPPFFVLNKMKGGFPRNEDEINHHPNHAKALKEKADSLGIQAVVYAPEIGIVDKSEKDFVAFILENLKK